MRAIEYLGWSAESVSREQSRGHPIPCRKSHLKWTGVLCRVRFPSHKSGCFTTGETERSFRRLWIEIEDGSRSCRRAESAADGGRVKAESVLFCRPDGHRNAVLDLASENDRSDEIISASPRQFAEGKGSRYHDGNRMEYSLRMMRLDIAGVSHCPVRKRRLDSIGAEAMSNNAGLRFAAK